MNTSGVVASDTIIFFIGLIAVAVMSIITITLGANLIDDHHDAINEQSGYLTNQVYVFRSVFSKDCLAYEDIRVNPGIVDIYKFDTFLLGHCIDRKDFGAKLTLTTDTDERVAYNNKGYYEIIQPLCFSKKYVCDTITMPNIFVHDGQGITQGTLQFDVVLGVA